MATKRTVLVIGATGQQGGAVANALIARGHQVVAGTRNVDSPAAKQLANQGADILKMDITEGSLADAMKNVDSVFAMTTPFENGTEAEIKQGIAIADGAKEAGVGHLVFSSVAGADRPTGIPHFDSKHKVEKYIAKLGIPYTICGPVFFMENHFAPWSLPSLKAGKLQIAMPGDRSLQQVSVTNIGTFCATMVEMRERVFGKRIDIAGDDLSGEESAAILSKVSGRPIVYESLAPEMLRKDSEDMYLMFKWINDVGFSSDIDGLGRDYSEVGWQTLEDWAKEQDWSVLD